MSGHDEDQLLQGFLAGDQEAFGRILDTFATQLMHYAKRLLNNDALAEDVVQETFVKLWQTRDRYDPAKSSLSTWLHRIARNLCIDEFRRLKPEGDLPDEEDPAANPASQLSNQQRTKTVTAAIERLPEKQRSALILTYYQHLSHKEVAAILDMSVEGLESLLRRTRSKLKETLTAEAELL